MRVRLLPEERRSQLIDVTVELLEDVACSDVTVYDIASRAGVSRGLVYRYFSGIEDLVHHARWRFFDSLRADLTRINVDAQPLDQLREVITTSVRFATAERARFCNVIDGRPHGGMRCDPLVEAIEKVTGDLQANGDGTFVAATAASMIESGIVFWLHNDPVDENAAIDLLFTLATVGVRGGSGAL
jgi:AcrR family transcriptional regulator